MKERIKVVGQKSYAVMLLALSLPLLTLQLARADWIASGQFQYTDRTYTQEGFTGTVILPVRESDFEIYDINTLAVLGSGATDTNGNFNISVADTATREVTVRVLASTTQTPDIDFSVVDDLNENAIYSYHDDGSDVSDHSMTMDVNFGTMLMPAAIGNVVTTDWSSQIFNILDLCIRAADWITSVDGARPSQPLTIGWNPDRDTSRTGSSYSSGSNRINLADNDGYDDPNILHEIGHWVEDEFGRSRNIGGSHSSSDDDQDPRLSWSEGFATAVSGATLNFHGLPHPNIYSDRDSFDSDGGGGFAYNFELGQNGGSTQERAVSAAIYDLLDDNASNDTSPGSDDDPLGGLDSNVWSVIEEMRVQQLPATSLEDFWDLWRDLNLGDELPVQTVFAEHEIDFMIDSSEPDDLRSSANTLTGSYVEHTFYRSGAEPGGDEDWYQFNATGGTYYRIQVNGIANEIYGRPDPEFYLLGNDGETVLAYNDDPLDTTLNGRTSNNNMIETVPEILWRAPANGTYYVYCRHASYERNLGGRYGTYNIRVVTAGSPTPTITAVASQLMLPGEQYQVLITGTEMAVDTIITTSSNDVAIRETRWIAPEAVVARLGIAESATAGSFSVTVSNPGAGSAVEISALTIDTSAQPPIIIAEVDLGTSDKVELKNIGNLPADLTGWQIVGRRATSATQQIFTFPSFTITPGATVSISDGPGIATTTELFDESGVFDWTWSNTYGGDISLLDDAGRNVDYIRWIRSYARPQHAPLGTGAAWMQPEMRTPASGLTVSVDKDASFSRTMIGISGANPTIPIGAPGHDNAVDAFEDNDDPRRAPVLTTPSYISGLTISPRPNASTDDDWFGVPVSASESLDITAQFNHDSGNLDLEVYAPGHESTPLLSAMSTTDDETISLTETLTTENGSGIYRLRIFGFEDETNTYSLVIGDPPPLFIVTPTVTQVFSGTEGGPFVPDCLQYTLKNNNAFSINWQVTSTASWITLETTFGSIATEGSTILHVCVDSIQANPLPSSLYSDILTFEDLTNMVTLSHQVDLQVNISDFSSWLSDFFTEAEISSGYGNPNYDFDGDGYINQFEYYFGTDPRSNVNIRTPEVSVKSNAPALTYTRRINAPDVIYSVETSDDLLTWTARVVGTDASDLTIVSGPTDNSDNTETLKLKYNTNFEAIPNGCLFFRVSANE